MATGPKVLYEFGPFRVDPDKQVLLREDQLVAVTPKAFATLLILVRHSREVVSKDELMKAVWPDAFVEEANLSQNIFMLRKALGETPEDHRYIVTLPGRGYRFAAQVRTVTPDGEDLIIESRTCSQVIVEQTDVAPVESSHTLSLRPHRRVSWKYLLPIVAVLGLAVLAPAFFLRKQPPTGLGTADSVLVADFTNATGDPVFDGALRQGLEVQLEQSPYLRLVSEDHVQQTLGLMGQPADSRITPTIARELCQRTGSAAVLNGSITQIGTQYLLTLKAVNCVSGESLASTEAQANDKDHVLDALGKTASEIRNKLGESLSTVRKFDTPLEQATTPSLDALQAYSLGRNASAGSNWTAAVPFFLRAIHLDGNFAMSYARLGTSYSNLGETTLGVDNTRKAYELRERVSEREKFYIESHYLHHAIGDLEKARQVYELWSQTYPRDWVAPINLGDIYRDLGQYDKSLAEARKTVSLDSNALAYAFLVDAYLFLNRLEEARATATDAQVRKFDSPTLRDTLFKIAFLQNDAAGMAEQAEWAVSKPGVEDRLLAGEARTAAYSGRLKEAREFSRRAKNSAERAEEREVAATHEADAALREALFGNSGEARQRATAAMGLSAGQDMQFPAALALAFAGEAVRAQKLTDDLGKRFPENTIVHFNYLPTIRAQLALSRNDSSTAIEVLQAAAAYELGSLGGLYPVYVRGEAYLAAHQGTEAAVEFQKILNHRGVVLNSPIGALAHLQLGRAYAMQGDAAKARAAYQDFLTLWKDADPDIPVLKQAETEYARLQ